MHKPDSSLHDISEALNGRERITIFTQCDNVCLRWLEHRMLYEGLLELNQLNDLKHLCVSKTQSSDHCTFPSTAGAALAALGLGSFFAAGQLNRCSARWPPHQQ